MEIEKVRAIIGKIDERQQRTRFSHSDGTLALALVRELAEALLPPLAQQDER